MESFGLTLCAEQDTNRGVCTDFPNGTPQSEEFLSLEEHARLIDKCLGKSGSAQDRRGRQAQFFQLRKGAARDAKVFIHRFTQI